MHINSTLCYIQLHTHAHKHTCKPVMGNVVPHFSLTLHIFVPLSSYCYYDCSFLSSLMPFQLCTWPLPLNTCFVCYHNRLQVCLCMCVSASFLRLSVCDFCPVFFFLTTIYKCKLCQAKDQSVADAHTGDVSADLCLRVRWQLSVSVTCWFILWTSVLIPPPLTPPIPPLHDLNPFLHLSYL